MREADADLVGLQEALEAQIAALAPGLAAVPRLVGVGREMTSRAESTRRSCIGREPLPCLRTLARSGSRIRRRWSASRSWGNNITRICTWARFVNSDGGKPSGTTTSTSTTSRSRRASGARSCCAAASRPGAPREPVVVTGDFKVGEDQPRASRARGSRAQIARAVPRYVRVGHPDERASARSRLQIRQADGRQD